MTRMQYIHMLSLLMFCLCSFAYPNRVEAQLELPVDRKLRILNTTNNPISYNLSRENGPEESFTIRPHSLAEHGTDVPKSRFFLGYDHSFEDGYQNSGHGAQAGKLYYFYLAPGGGRIRFNEVRSPKKFITIHNGTNNLVRYSLRNTNGYWSDKQLQPLKSYTFFHVTPEKGPYRVKYDASSLDGFQPLERDLHSGKYYVFKVTPNAQSLVLQDRGSRSDNRNLPNSRKIWIVNRTNQSLYYRVQRCGGKWAEQNISPNLQIVHGNTAPEPIFRVRFDNSPASGYQPTTIITPPGRRYIFYFNNGRYTLVPEQG